MMGIAIGATAMIAFGGLLLIAALFSGIAQPERSQTCMDEATRDHVRAVMLDGIEQALQIQTSTLFRVRMREYTGPPQAALVGLNNSITAYINIRRAINEWSPPTC